MKAELRKCGMNRTMRPGERISGYWDIEVERALLDAAREEEEKVNHPSHYQHGGYECIDVIDAITGELLGVEAFCTGNAIKYLWRWKNKNGVEDLKKAKWYIDRLISEMDADD